MDLQEKIPIIQDVIRVEYQKYLETKKKIQKLLPKIKKKIESMSEDELAKYLFELYISQGITPELVVDKVPYKFYELLEEHREKSKKEKREKVLDIDVAKYPETEFLFWKDTFLKFNEARLLGVEKDYAIFDRTVFYPTAGGQKNDTGWIVDKNDLIKIYALAKVYGNIVFESVGLPYYKDIEEHYKDAINYAKSLIEKELENLSEEEKLNKYFEYLNELKGIPIVRVIDVVKLSKRILHKVDNVEKLKQIKEPVLIIDFERRLILSRHHTATHILTAVSRKVLGFHVWQAGAEKDVDKARLDITHYKPLTKEELREIERLANKAVLEMRKINKFFMERTEAEQKYGFTIYQGGAVPEKVLRIVEIEGLDVEACGGTHLDNSIQVGPIKIVKAKKIADGVIRLEFVAGEKAIEEMQKEREILEKASEIAKVDISNLPKAVEKFFNEWKKTEKELDLLKQEYFRLLMEKINRGENVIKVPDFFSIGDFMRFISKVRGSVDWLVIYNKSFAAGFGEKAKEKIKELGFNKIVEEKGIVKGLLV